MSVTGGCLCGAVSISADGEPIFTGKCYCTDCQKGTGSGHSNVAAFPEPAVRVTGPLTEYVKKGESGLDVTRAFCPTCGSRIYTSAAAMPGMLLLQAGTLNEANRIAPGMSIYAASAAHWDQPPAHIPSFPGMPPASI